jgi:shikimate dehydrogenase
LSADRLGVVGYPVAHSLSPAIQNAALEALGLDAWRFQLLPVPPELFDETVSALPASGFRGVSVTVPHKEAALALAGEATAAAREIGAANTLIFEDGVIRADNTDAPGFIASLPSEPKPGSTALVLGAGGSARAVAWALSHAGVEVKVWNRTAERAQKLAADLGVEAVPEPVGAELLVNCTTAGMDGDPFTVLPVSPSELGDYGTVVDLVYADPEGRLLAAGQAAGAQVADGIEILVRQGAIALERWTGMPAPLEVMRDAARQAPGR